MKTDTNQTHKTWTLPQNAIEDTLFSKAKHSSEHTHHKL